MSPLLTLTPRVDTDTTNQRPVFLSIDQSEAVTGDAWCWGRAGWTKGDHRSRIDSASASEPLGLPDTERKLTSSHLAASIN